MGKQTAVEWLQEQLKKGVDFNPLDKNSYLDNVEKLFEQAKAIEHEQITEAYYKGTEMASLAPKKMNIPNK
jgi:hypothetical protein